MEPFGIFLDVGYGLWTGMIPVVGRLELANFQGLLTGTGNTGYQFR